MLNSDQTNSALAVLHHIMIATRFRAGTGSGKEDLKRIMNIMDDTEYLVALMMKENDETNCFWNHVNGMSEKYPEFVGIYQKYRSGQ